MAGDKEAGFPTQCSAITMFSFCILCVAAPVAKFWNSPHARATTLHKFQFETMNSASTPTLTSTAGSQEYRNPTGAWQHPRRYKFLVVNFYDNLYWCHCTRLIAGSEERTSRRARFFLRFGIQPVYQSLIMASNGDDDVEQLLACKGKKLLHKERLPERSLASRKSNHKPASPNAKVCNLAPQVVRKLLSVNPPCWMGLQQRWWMSRNCSSGPGQQFAGSGSIKTPGRFAFARGLDAPFWWNSRS